MKKKLFTLLTLLLTVCSGAWATDYILASSTFNGDKNVSTVDHVVFSFSKAHGGSGMDGYSNYIKFSKGSTYTITLPAGFAITNINVKGYTNSDNKTDGELTSVAGVAQTGKTFPAKNNASLATQAQITDGYDFAVNQTGGTVSFVTNNTNQICVLITITGTLPSTLTGAWSKTSDNVDKNASAPSLPTFAVGATSGTPTASNYNVEYSLKDGSTAGILTINASTGVTGISTSTVGTATCVATVTSTDTDDFKDPSPNTFEYTITVNELVCATPTFTVYGNKVVKIVSATAGSTIYYGGSDVKTGDKTEYTGQFIPASSGTIYAYATKAGFEDSGVASQAITLPDVGDVVGNKLMTLQPEAVPSGDTDYDGNTFTKGGYTLESDKTLANSRMDGYPCNFKATVNTGTFTITPPSNVTIQSIKIYGTSNDNSKETSVAAGDGGTIITTPSALMVRNILIGGNVVMSEVVMTVDTPTEGAPVSFKLGSSASQARFYVEVYGTTSATSATINVAKEYTTYIPTYDLDFSSAAELTAYIATAATASTVTMTPINKVPAGTPVVLKATTLNADIAVNVAASTDDVSANKLKIGDGKTSIGGTGKYDYVLSNGVFYHASAGILPAGKCFLHLDAAPAAAANELTMDFGEGGTTGISEIEKMRNGENETFFDLQGRKIAQPAKGLYIVNGCKVIVK